MAKIQRPTSAEAAKMTDGQRAREALRQADLRDGSPASKPKPTKSAGPRRSGPTTRGLTSGTGAGNGGKPPTNSGNKLPVRANGTAATPHVKSGEYIKRTQPPSTSSVAPKTGTTITQAKPSMLGKVAGWLGGRATGAVGLALTPSSLGDGTLDAWNKSPQGKAAAEAAKAKSAPKAPAPKAESKPAPKAKVTSSPKPKVATSPKPKVAPKSVPKPKFSQGLKDLAAGEQKALRSDPRAAKKGPVTFKPKPSIKRGPSVFES